MMFFYALCITVFLTAVLLLNLLVPPGRFRKLFKNHLPKQVNEERYNPATEKE